jgi:alginate O-acetyltransferase complex protein AlgI
MNAYTPADWHALLPVAGIGGVLLLLGLAARGGRLRALCWLAGPVAIVAAHFLLFGEPPGVRMLALVGVTFLWTKALFTASRRDSSSAVHWLAWATLWPGMQLRSTAVPAAWRGLLFRGVVRMAAGVAFVVAAYLLFRHTANAWIATPPLLIGLSLILHFGLFNMITAAWRQAGFDAQPPFHAPHRSGSLREFWSRRWNVGYSELMQAAVFRPLRRHPKLATAAVFLFSGLLHEVAISVPVQAGYGLPTSYFLLHGAATLLEPRIVTPGTLPARIWTAAIVLIPLPVLFHPAFLRGIVWPLGGAT